MKLFFYGTLRKGGIFAERLPKGRKIQLCQINGLRMYRLRQYPGAQATGDKDDFVIGEVVDFRGIFSRDEWKDFIGRMDNIEGTTYNLFERSTIETPYGEAIIYLVTTKALENFKKVYGEDPNVLTDWASIDPGVADMVKTLDKEKDDVTIRAAEQED